MNMPPACVYSARDGNGKIGRQAAYLPDHCLRDGVGGRNGNSRLLAAAAAIRESFQAKYFQVQQFRPNSVESDMSRAKNEERISGPPSQRSTVRRMLFTS
jgi:hypothetical protein